MPDRPSLERWLQTPRGILALLGASLCASALLAILVGSQRAWFEGRVEERWPAVSATIDSVGRELRAPDAVRRIRALPEADRRALYGGWLGGATGWPELAPRWMFAADPAFFLARAQGTLLAGSAPQRLRAARFLAASGSPSGRALVVRAERRARERREHELASELVALRSGS